MAKPTHVLTPVAQTLPQERLDQIMNDLIAKIGPEFPGEKVPETFRQIVAIYLENMPKPAPQPEIKIRKKRVNTSGYRPAGWPSGVQRAAYKTWKAEQEALGRVEGLNPWTYKTEVLGGEQTGGSIEQELTNDIGGGNGEVVGTVARDNQEWDDDKLDENANFDAENGSKELVTAGVSANADASETNVESQLVLDIGKAGSDKPETTPATTTKANKTGKAGTKAAKVQAGNGSVDSVLAK